MKVNVINPPTGIIQASEMKIGQIAQTVDKSWNGVILLRTYERFVNLQEPNNTWTVLNTNVIVFPICTKIELEVTV